VDEKIIIETYNAGISSVIKLVNDLSSQIGKLALRRFIWVSQNQAYQQ